MSEQVEKFDLDRVTNVENNIDAFGKKWDIVRQNRANALLVARPQPYRKDFVCPEEFQGSWTSFDQLQAQIKAYVVETWNMADKAKNPSKKSANQKARDTVAKLPTKIKKELGLDY